MLEEAGVLYTHDEKEALPDRTRFQYYCQVNGRKKPFVRQIWVASFDDLLKLLNYWNSRASKWKYWAWA